MKSIGISSDNQKDKYYEIGFKSAMDSKGAPEALPEYLEGIYRSLSKVSSYSETELEDLVENLENTLTKEEEKKEKQEGSLRSMQYMIAELEGEIDDVNSITSSEEKADLSSGFFSFAFGAVITLLLTLYLFLFYSSTGFSTLYGVQEKGNSVFNVDVFTDAGSRGGSAFGFVILFPVIFLAVGFVMHIFLERYKASKRQNKQADFMGVGLILVVTFLADALIGYKIAEGLHMRDYNQGITIDIWEFGMIWSDVNFYLILFLGFAVYVIWGFLLNYVLTHDYLNSWQRNQYKIARADNTRKELVEMSIRLKREEEKFEADSEQIQIRKAALTKLKMGEIPKLIVFERLEKVVGEFMEGYYTYFINALGESDHAKERIAGADKIVRKWLLSKKLNR